MSLTEALETRKALNDRLGELHTQVVDSAYERILHKEERDIVEDNELPYDDCRTRLDARRVPPAQSADSRRVVRGRGGIC